MTIFNVFICFSNIFLSIALMENSAINRNEKIQ